MAQKSKKKWKKTLFFCKNIFEKKNVKKKLKKKIQKKF